MSNHLSPTVVRKIGALLADGTSARATARALKLSRETVLKYAVKLQPEKCVCGKEARHKGWCGPRYLKSSVHKEVLAKIHSDFVEPPRPAKRVAPTVRNEYPYCIGRPNDGHALLMSVNAVVSKRLPDDARADVCQDLLLSILEGDLKIEELIPAVKPAIAKRNAMFSAFNLSLDAPAGYEPDGTPLTFLEILPSDYEPILGKRSVRRMNAPKQDRAWIEAELQRAYDVLWEGDGEACDAITAYLPEKDVKEMLDAWLEDQSGDEPKSRWN